MSAERGPREAPSTIATGQGNEHEERTRPVELRRASELAQDGWRWIEHGLAELAVAHRTTCTPLAVAPWVRDRVRRWVTEELTDDRLDLLADALVAEAATHARPRGRAA